MQKTVIQYIVHQGSGSHLLLDLTRQAGWTHVSHTHFLYIQALVLARKDPDAPSLVMEHEGKQALTVVEDIYKKYEYTPEGDPLSDASACRFMGHVLTYIEAQAISFSHFSGLSVSAELSFEDGRHVQWTLEDRDEAIRLLKYALSENGYSYRSIAWLRHPVDMYISTIGRSGQSADHKLRSIPEFCKFVRQLQSEENVPVVKYEDVCAKRLPAIEKLFQELGCPIPEEGLDLSMIHQGAMDKWVHWPQSKVGELAKQFSEAIEQFDYPYPKLNFFQRTGKVTALQVKKWVSEFVVINKICAGDFTVDSAFTRHTRSFLGRPYFRLKLLWPRARRNVDQFYQEFGKGRNPVTSPQTALKNYLRDLVGYSVFNTRSER